MQEIYSLKKLYNEFKNYVDEKVSGGFHITKDVGYFICKKT